MNKKKHLSRVFNEAFKNTITYNDTSKFILFSDCHRGDNSFSDDFAHNQTIFYHALYYYYKEGFTYIEIGDGEELWENKYFSDIREAYSSIYQLMKKFYDKKRLILLWGNHNIDWKNTKMVKKYLYSYFSEKEEKIIQLFNKIEVYEGLILKHSKKNNYIFLVHGHQGEMNNDLFLGFSRFITRYIWKYLQIIGVNDPTSPAKNFTVRKKVEKKIKEWSKKNNQMIITGHTHRPVFPKPQETAYFNTGSCVHPNSITGIEIYKGNIALVEWFINTKTDGTLFIDKNELANPQKIDSYFYNK